VVDRVLQLGTVLVLARLLGPTAFGVYGIALVALHALSRLTNLGFKPALVSIPATDVDPYLDTAWTLRIGRGLVLWVVAVVLAPVVASVFGTPQVAPVMRVLGAGPLLSGLMNPGAVYFSKELAFHRKFGLRVGSRVVETVVALSVAVVEPTIWALVWGLLAYKVATMVLSYSLHDYRPRPGFDRSLAGELVEYGRWIAVSSALSYLSGEGDDAFVGWFLGGTALGLYSLSYRLSNAPATEVTHTISETVFPAYSKLQDDTESLRRGFFDTLQVTALLSVPMAIGIALVAEPFVAAVLGTAWRAMVVPLQLLAAYGLLRSLRSGTVPLFRAVGRPRLETVTRAATLGPMVVAIYPASAAYGLPGTVGAVLLGALVGTPLASVLALRIVDGGVGDFLARLAPPVTASAGMVATVVGVRSVLAGSSAVVTLVAMVAVGVVSYPAILLLAEYRFDIGLKRLHRTVRGGMG
jgi:O-antigen/teichoic acid export membrane protein